MWIDGSLLTSRLPDLSSLLTPPQLDAVQYSAGHSLILAGAGSGKTRVLIYKICRILSEQLAAPDEILAVTFTNKAAAEMRARAAQYLGYPVHLPWLGTFHSICVRVMRRWLPETKQGYFRSRNFSIYDEEDSRKLCSRILKEEVYRDLGIDFRTMQRAVSKWKNDFVSVQEANLEAVHAEQIALASLYTRYEELLRSNNALDFDDLLLHAVHLLERDPAVLGALRSRFRYIFVDEYQDTNAAQYRLIRLLTDHPSTQLTVVGDDDQSIYGWRGADVTILRNFVSDFPQAKVFKLEENFRSSERIVRAAGAVISHNQRIPGLEKSVFSRRKEGDYVRLIYNTDETEEARRTVEIMQVLGSSCWMNSAVFYRTNAQSRQLEKAFAQAKIPCRIYGGVSFYQRKEIKDIFAYLTLLVNRDDEGALRRIINIPRRGIGDVAMANLTRWALDHSAPLIDALAQGEEIVGRSGKKLVKLYQIIEELRGQSGDLTLPQLVKSLLEQIGYRDFLLADGSEESMERVANIDELLNDVEEREEESPGITLEEFVSEIVLATDADDDHGAENYVRLMTLHSAKGLEFDNVVIVGCENMFMPLKRHDTTPAEVEEERRLFYVGMTRAKERLWLLTTSMRRHQGRIEISQPSPFLRELDALVCHFSHSPRVFGFTHLASSEDEQKKRPSDLLSNRKKSLRKPREFLEEDVSQENIYLSIGSRVRHPRFGVGTVLSASGQGPNDRVTIRFSDGQERCLVLQYAMLTVIG